MAGWDGDPRPPAGRLVTRRRRISYELVTCGLEGHWFLDEDALPDGGGAADHTPARGSQGALRCARCGDLVTVGPGPVDRHADAPLRGEALRDRYVLRLIALDRALHVIVLAGLAVAIFLFSGHERSLRASYLHVLNALYGNGGGGSAHGFLLRLRHYFYVTPGHLREVGAAVIAYGALEAAEMVGLWRGRRWAEYLTFVATTVLLPLEVYELAHSVTVLKLITFIINLAIVLWLLWKKRLFGIRGGAGAERARLADSPVPG